MSQATHLLKLKEFLKSITSLISYAKQVESSSTMKIVGMDEETMTLKVQCKFRNIDFDTTAAELIQQDLIMCFDKSDIAVISYFKGLQEVKERNPSLMVNSVDFVTDESNRVVVTCSDNKKTYNFRKTASELINDMKLMGQFPTKDIVKISYMAGREESL